MPSARDMPVLRFRTWLVLIEEFSKRTDRSANNADMQRLLLEADVMANLCLRGIESLATEMAREL